MCGWPIRGAHIKLVASDVCHRDQRQAYIAYPLEHPIQRGLVDDRAVDSGDAVALKREAQAVKPADPAPIEVALEADLATSGLVTIAR